MRNKLDYLKNLALIAPGPISIICFLPLWIVFGSLGVHEPGDRDPWDH